MDIIYLILQKLCLFEKFICGPVHFIGKDECVDLCLPIVAAQRRDGG